jgi:hypothetical protein
MPHWHVHLRQRMPCHAIAQCHCICGSAAGGPVRAVQLPWARRAWAPSRRRAGRRRRSWAAPGHPCKGAWQLVFCRFLMGPGSLCQGARQLVLLLYPDEAQNSGLVVCTCTPAPAQCNCTVLCPDLTCQCRLPPAACTCVLMPPRGRGYISGMQGGRYISGMPPAVGCSP